MYVHGVCIASSLKVSALFKGITVFIIIFKLQKTGSGNLLNQA